MTTETEEIFVPKAVADQEKAVEDFYRQNTEAGGSAPEPASPEPATPEPKEPDPENPPEEPRAPEEPLAAEPGDKDEPKKPEDSFEQRYKALKGKYDAEVPRLHGQVRALTDKNQRLEQKVTDLEAKANKAPEADLQDTDYNLDDFEDYGPEVVKLAKANQKLQQDLKNVQEQLSNVTSEVTSTKQQTGKNDFMTTLAERVDGWDEQNNDPEFIGWLQNTEPLTGYSYNQLLGSAQSQNDGSRAAQIFLKFREETGKKYAPGSTSKQPGAQQQQKIPQPTVAPPKSRSGGAPETSDQGRFFTKEDVAEFYKDYAQGKLDGMPATEEELKKREQEIFKAKREGRLR